MTGTFDQHVAAFEAHRRALTGLAYRMLGSRADAEDVVQDAYLRWHSVDPAGIEEPRRYLGTVVTRLCLDRMKSAQARREVGVKSMSDSGYQNQSSTKFSTAKAKATWPMTSRWR